MSADNKVAGQAPLSQASTPDPTGSSEASARAPWTAPPRSRSPDLRKVSSFRKSGSNASTGGKVQKMPSGCSRSRRPDQRQTSPASFRKTGSNVSASTLPASRPHSGTFARSRSDRSAGRMAPGSRLHKMETVSDVHHGRNRVPDPHRRGPSRPTPSRPPSGLHRAPGADEFFYTSVPCRGTDLTSQPRHIDQ